MEKNYDFRKRLLQIHEKDVRNNNRTVTENEYEIIGKPYDDKKQAERAWNSRSI